MPYRNADDHKAQARRWRENNAEKAREIKRRSRMLHYEGIKARREATKEQNHTRDLAQYRFRFAVKRGWIARPEGMEFHHPDYERPYFGVWVTPLCHRRIHTALAECPQCVDYAMWVEEQRAAAITQRQTNAARTMNRKRWGAALDGDA